MDLGPWVQAILEDGKAPLAAAFLIGLLASLGPCPLATNVAALGYISKEISSFAQEMSQMSQPLRILLADDHVLFRKGLRALIAAREDMVVMGEARDGLEAAALARETAPDIVLLDINMPRCSGLEAIPLILRDLPQARIIMLTVSEEGHDLFAAIKSGAFGYLLKDLEPQQLFDLLEGVRRGEAPIASVMATKILHEFRQMSASPAPMPEMPDELTAREVEVLKLVASGATNREIATALSITENTVKIHLRNILEKLHLQNRIQATAYAVRHGLADNPGVTE